MHQSDRELVSRVEKKIGVTFEDKRVLLVALTTKEFVWENPEASELGDNREFEWIGDGLLEGIVRGYLVSHRAPGETLVELTRYCRELVSNRCLADIGISLGLHLDIRGTVYQKKSLRIGRSYMKVACAMEAIIQAINLDVGYGEARSFVHRLVCSRLPEVRQRHLNTPFVRFRLLVTRLGKKPGMRTVKQNGKIPTGRVRSVALIDGQDFASGMGSTKPASMEEAARRALIKLARMHPQLFTRVEPTAPRSEPSRTLSSTNKRTSPATTSRAPSNVEPEPPPASTPQVELEVQKYAEGTPNSAVEKLQRRLLEQLGVLPTYEVEQRSGSQTWFVGQVFVGEQRIGIGVGSSAEKSKEQSAIRALEGLSFIRLRRPRRKPSPRNRRRRKSR